MPTLATVPNTGSHFALKVFEPHYCRKNLTEPVQEGEEPLFFSHCDTEQLARIKERAHEYPPLILTMRHPMAVASSWIKRGNEMDHRFKALWENLFRLSDSPLAIWMPIDTQDREMRLEIISKVIHKPLETDWMPEGVYYGGTKQYRGGMEMREVREFFLEYAGRFERFGYVI